MKLGQWIYKNLKNGYFRMKGMGIFALVPIIILYVCIPLINYAAYQYFENPDVLYDNVITMGRYMIPICSVWYILFTLYHFIEEPGNEMLYLEKKGKLIDLVFPYFAYEVLLLPLFLIYTQFFPELWFFFLQLCMIDLTLLAFCYCTAFLANTISVGAIGVLVYMVFDWMMNNNNSRIFIYKEAAETPGLFMKGEILPYLLVTFCFCVVGMIGNRYTVKYK